MASDCYPGKFERQIPLRLRGGIYSPEGQLQSPPATPEPPCSSGICSKAVVHCVYRYEYGSCTADWSSRGSCIQSHP